MKPSHAAATFAIAFAAFMGLSAAIGSSDYGQVHAEGGYGIQTIAQSN